MKKPLLAIFCLLFLQQVQGQGKVEVLKLDYVETQDDVVGGKVTRETHNRVLYLARDGRAREEISDAQGNVSRVEIQNPSQRLGFVLHPNAKTAHQWAMQPPPGAKPTVPEKVGERTIQGFQCAGSRVTFPGNSHNPSSRTIENWRCMDEETGQSFTGSYQVRGANGHLHERNLVRVTRHVTVEASLFGVPSDYQIHPSPAK